MMCQIPQLGEDVIGRFAALARWLTGKSEVRQLLLENEPHFVELPPESGDPDEPGTLRQNEVVLKLMVRVDLVEAERALQARLDEQQRIDSAIRGENPRE